MRLRALRRIALLATFVGGCIFIPTPGMNVGGSRDDLTEEDVVFIEPGVTTRVDVLRRLGEPDSCSDDQRRFSYLWIDVYGLVVFGAGGTGGAGAAGGAGAFHVTGDDALVVTFDEQGVVVSAEFGEPEEDELLEESMPALRID